MKKFFSNSLFKLLITPLTYIVCGVFIIFSVLQFFIFQRFFSEVGTSDLHRFFSGIPYISVLVVPALGSFISFSKENLSQPCSALEISLGKTLALFTATAVCLSLTITVPVAVSFFGNVEFSSVLCGYLGMTLYLAATSSLSVFMYTAIENTGFAFIVQAIVLAAINSVHGLASYMSSGNILSSLAKHISFAWHFDAEGKGIIDSRDLAFFISMFIIFVMASTASMELKRGRPTLFMKKVALLSLAAFFLLAIDSGRLYFRIDTTSTKKFSVSKYSKSILKELEEPMSITYYRSSSLKNLYPQSRDVDDFLQAYAASSNMISYSVIDPVKENVTKKLNSYGIVGQNIRSSGNDSTSYTTVYSAIVISYLGQTGVIPYVLSTSMLEYSLDEKLNSMVRDKTKIIQVVIGNGLNMDEDYAYVKPWLESQDYYVTRTYLPSEIIEGKTEIFTLYPEIPLLVFGTALFTQEDSQALMNFIRSGGKVFLATGAYTVDIKNTWSVIDVNDYVLYDLQSLGIYYKDTITCDSENYRLSLYADTNAANSNFQQQNEYINYSMWPVLGSQDNAVTGMTCFWPCSIDFDNEVANEEGYSVESHLTTSKNAWQSKKVDGKFITNPFSVSLVPEQGEETGKFNVAVSVKKAGDKTPFLIATGDQYSFSTGMIGYSSSGTIMDSRSLDFLADSILLINGETALLDLKKSGYSNTGLYKTTPEKLYRSRIFVMFMSCVIPILILAAIFVIVTIRRKKLAGVLNEIK